MEVTMRLTSKATVGRDVLVLFLLITLVQGGQPSDGEGSILLGPPLDNLKDFLQPQQVHEDSSASETIAKDTEHVQGHLEASQHLKCSRTDIFQVLGSCRDFYYCKDATGQELEWSAFRFTCPQGRVFDVDSKVCNIPSLVTGHPECQSTGPSPGGNEVHEKLPGDNEVLETGTDRDSFDEIVRDSPMKRRERRSTEVQCSNEEVERMGNNTDDPCTDFKNIDNYITRLNSMNSSELPSFDQKLYKAIIVAYNRDLEIAQDNANDWRNNNNVLNSIKESFLLANEFELNFINRFVVNIERIGIIIDNRGQINFAINETLKPLRTKLKQLSEMLLTVHNTKVLMDIENYIRATKEQIIRLERAYYEVKRRYEIPKFINFLEMVRNDVLEIKIKVEDTEGKLGNFEKNIGHDLSRFKRHQIMLKEGILKLEKDRDENHKQILKIPKDIIKLYKKISDTRRRKSDSLRALGRVRRKRSPVEPVTVGIYVAGAVIGGWILKSLFPKPPVYINNDDELRRLRERIRLLEREIEGYLNEISFYNNILSTMQKKYEDLTNEISQFSQLNVTFQSLQDEVNYIEPSVKNAKNSIMKIKRIFEELLFRLETLITNAKIAKREIVNGNIMYFIYNDIFAIMCIWNKISYMMILFGGCTL